MKSEDIHLLQIALELAGYLATEKMEWTVIEEEVRSRLDEYGLEQDRYDDAVTLTRSLYLFGRQIGNSR